MLTSLLCSVLSAFWPEHLKRLCPSQKLYVLTQAVVTAVIIPAIHVYDFLFTRHPPLVAVGEEEHARRAQHVQTQVKAAKVFPLFTARPDHERVSSRVLDKRPGTGIRLDKLKSIVSLDQEKGTIKVEPGVRMCDLSEYLTEEKTNFMLACVPELDDLTVSGLLMGCGIETMSFKCGMFQECVLSYEVLMADGEIHVITKESDAEVAGGNYSRSQGGGGRARRFVIRAVGCGADSTSILRRRRTGGCIARNTNFFERNDKTYLHGRLEF